MPPEEFEEVLRFWFPLYLSNDNAVMVRQFDRKHLIAASRSPPRMCPPCTLF
jgi:hypothetical protein